MRETEDPQRRKRPFALQAVLDPLADGHRSWPSGIRRRWRSSESRLAFGKTRGNIEQRIFRLSVVFEQPIVLPRDDTSGSHGTFLSARISLRFTPGL